MIELFITYNHKTTKKTYNSLDSVMKWYRYYKNKFKLSNSRFAKLRLFNDGEMIREYDYINYTPKDFFIVPWGYTIEGGKI